jgi:hypothetical protein
MSESEDDNDNDDLDDQDYIAETTPRVLRPGARREGGQSIETLENRRAARREYHERIRATETEQDRLRRRASNLASVQARRARIRTAEEEETRTLELEARRRSAAFFAERAASAHSSSQITTNRDLEEARLSFYKLILPTIGPSSPQRVPNC